jgi:hypothetical protein
MMTQQKELNQTMPITNAESSNNGGTGPTAMLTAYQKKSHSDNLTAKGQ